jgi:hypothetical protein
MKRFAPWLAFALIVPATAPAQSPPSAPAVDEAAEIAKKLNNPVAALISVPLQNNWDYGIGTANAMKYTLNIQPVVPLSISKEWNVIVRQIVPIISAESPAPGGSTSSGLGDIVQSFFLSPKEPTKGGWIIGAGPVFLYPSASHDALGAGKWAAGPTIVVLKQEHGFTYGLLANQLWSFAGWGPTSVNAMFLQPFLAYTTRKYTTFGLNTESTYNWTASEWTVPINASVTQMLKIKKQIISLQFGYRYYATAPTGGPNHGWRFALTFVFPKK